MRRTFLTLLALAAGAALLASPVRAEDPAGPQPLAKASNAFLDSLVGSWDASVKAMGTDLKGTDRWTKAVGDTAWAHELSFGTGKDAFHGLGVLRVGGDGKSLTMWWFDSMGEGKVWKFQGTVTADGFEVKSEEGGMKASKGLKKAEGGLAYRMTVGGDEVVAGSWKKAAKEVAPAAIDPEKCPLAKHPFVKAELGDWTITTDDGEYEGKTSFRLGVGGSHVVQDYALDAKAGGESHRGFGVSSVAEDGKSMNAWWFGNHFVEPLVLTGSLTSTEWSAKGTMPGMGAFTLVVSHKDGNKMESATTMGDAVMKEQYTRAAAGK